MSSNSIIECISSARLHAESLVTDNYRKDVFEYLIIGLGALKTFVLCGKKLRNDARFKQFLVQIEERLHREADAFLGESDAFQGAERFTKFTFSLLEEEVGKWFENILDCSCIPSLMSREIGEIITSILEMLNDGVEELYPLKLHMRFLRSLIYFVTNGSTEARKDLLAHSETIAINTECLLAHSLCRLYRSSDDDIRQMRTWEEMISEVSSWVKKMHPSDPQVYEIYTQSLSGSKLSKQLFDGDDLLALKNFLDSLMCILADIIFTNTFHVVSMKDQLQELYERLISLKLILNRQFVVNFDMNIQKEIIDVVTDVGISICSFYQPQIDVKFGHWHFLDKLSPILLKIAEMDPHRPMFNSPRTSSYGFVDSILEKLSDLLTSSKAESTTKSHVLTIEVELASIKYTLGEFVDLCDEHVEVQTLWNRLLEVALKVEDAIDYQVLDPLSDFFSTSFDSIMEEIRCMKVDVLKIEVNKVRRATKSYLPAQTTLSVTNGVIGFQDEERAVLDRLLRGSQQLQLIAIVGMPGIGKTTLAKKVYNHSSLSRYFSAKAWCTISQVLDKKYVLLDLLKQICPVMSTEISEHDLADQLRRSLKGKRYVIFVDDIWNMEAWRNLKDSFPDDTKGSRIIYTSRSFDVAPLEMLDEEPLILSPLNEKDSLKLMCNKLFPEQGYVLPPELHDLGMKIVARCHGLPLAIIILAGVLANMETEAWDGFLGSFTFLSSEDNCRYTLEISYRYLPDYLKPCFLYFGAFPEDQEVSTGKLLRLWIAEGFIKRSKTSSPENVAEGYLNMLIGRSLIMVGKKSSNGGVKTCRIHDLLREFCLEKAKDEHFFHFAKGHVELFSFNEEPTLRRLLIVSEPGAVREPKLYCPHARSLLLRGVRGYVYGTSPMLQFFKLLKVLDLENIYIGSVFPTAIEQLLLLSFLAIKGFFLLIPPWLANLSNLETLIISLEKGNRISLPDNMWNLHKLKYLYIKYTYLPGAGGVFPVDNIDESSVLYELERFTNATIEWCSLEKQLRMFPNIRKLKCLLLGNMNGREYKDKFVFSDFSRKLESLGMYGCHMGGLEFGVRFEFSSLAKLKQLKLSRLYLYCEIFSVIGNQLSSLEVLKLEELTFKDENECIWEMKLEEFSKLRILDMKRMPIQRWIATEDHEFECFQKLVLYSCDKLEELPCCLESIETLDAIEVKYCSKVVEGLVAKIEVEQKEYWGNSNLQVTMVQR